MSTTSGEEKKPSPAAAAGASDRANVVAVPSCVDEGDDTGATALPRKSKAPRPTECIKCRAARPVLLLRDRDGYCRACMIDSMRTRVRSEMAKHKLLQPSELIVLAHSGGNRSSALVQLMHQFLQPDQKRPLRLNFVVIHINESNCLHEPASYSARPYFDPGALPQALGLAYREVPLEAVFAIDSATDDLREQSSQRLRQLLSQTTSLSAREDLISRLRIQLLCRQTRQLGSFKVVLGECNDGLCQRVLVEMSQGRGGSISSATAFASPSFDDCHLIRPLRGLSAREIGFFNHYHGLYPMPPVRPADGKPGRASLARLSQEFVATLLNEYSGAASTVVRTAEKVTSLISEAGDQRRCLLCLGPLEPPSALSSSCTAQQAAARDGASDESHDERSQLARRLCYGCRNILADVKGDLRLLPDRCFLPAKSLPADVASYLLPSGED